ncbi:MAG: drug resistance transporter, EmrB/QacA subfamily [Ilumatobacteraceae bacterium]|nr:drug resistance transporter, EmrB/QacA subfamily [Ilumatobacteraceae bacterium]
MTALDEQVDDADGVPEVVDAADPRRWITLGIMSATVIIISLDTTVLNVAIPTILKDFHTTLPSLQWVITGYALVFASLLIIGGRLGDLFGHRRIFVIGAALFGTGSLIAALSQSVPQLVIGEAVIEGVGAALMMPSSLAILSKSFVGHERAVAFGLWGAVGGASAAFGPVVGGFLTSDYSWRWSFGINVIIVPLAIIGALLFTPKLRHEGRRERLDIRGAVLVASGMALLVFGLSEGSEYGWLTPKRDILLGGHDIWPASRPVSLVIVAFVIAIVILTAFYRLSRAKERDDASPLFEFGQLRHRSFRFGLLTVAALSLGQLSLAFVLPVFLQEGRHLSAETNGLWQLPSGLCFLIGAQISSRLARRLPLAVIVRIGVVMTICGFAYLAIVISPSLQFWTLFPTYIMYGIGFGLSIPQITNIVLTEVEPDKAGAASGANNTAKQMGVSLGVAIIGSLVTSRTIASAVDRVGNASSLSPELKAQAAALLRKNGVTFIPPAHASAADVATLRRIFVEGLASGAKWPLVFSCITGLVSLIVSFGIPRRPAAAHDVVIDDEARLAAAH